METAAAVSRKMQFLEQRAKLQKVIDLVRGHRSSLNGRNESMNKIAYIGQGACCLYGGVPSSITMSSWSLLSNEVKERADKQAREVLNNWIEINKNKQLCLNLD